MDVAAEHVICKVLLEREEGNGWEIVDDNDGQDDEHHLEGPLLDRVHLVASGP